MGEGAQLARVEAGGRSDASHEDCPAREVLNHVTSRWGVWVLIALRDADLRYYELRRSLQGVSEKMLAQTLRALVHDGLVRREVEPTTPPQVTYGITTFGTEVVESLEELFQRIGRGPGAAAN
ncbi:MULTISPECIES: helix-turn-helix domain-containing protein [unclassified Streptomyces]|uniref:winged helix-turn-helix transcriptional regulator n=1 Tax=unclassified Streptomyces TaxID=2593676 RepID=UPI00278BC444|nr:MULTISPECIES: helix-turn-helix domain-containing protein [unclassified Streptomyces]